MKQFLKNISYFLMFFIVAYVIGVCVVGTYLPSYFKTGMRYRRCSGGHLFTRINEAKTVKDVDILFLGTSHCYRGFDTRIFTNEGYKVFNFGSSIQTALQTELLLDKYLDRLNPKMVIFEVNPTIFGSDGVESSLDVISNDKIDARTIEMAFKVNRMKTYNTLIFALYRQVFGIGATLTEKPNHGQDSYIRGGFVQTTYAPKRHIVPCKPVAYEFNEKQVEAFSSVLQMLKARKIRYVLVQAPITKPLFQSKTNNHYVDSLLATKGQYYNFNRLIRLNDTLDFFDDNHLTQRGVTKFNHALIARFEQDGLMP